MSWVAITWEPQQYTRNNGGIVGGSEDNWGNRVDKGSAREVVKIEPKSLKLKNLHC
jgi:hypothetical protein